MIIKKCKEKARGWLTAAYDIEGKFCVPYVMIALFAALLFVTRIRTFDNDNLFQIAHIRVLLQEGFIREEPLSMHTGMDFIIPQWASAFLIYALHENLGLIALNLYFFAVMTVAAFVLYKTLRLSEPDKTKASFSVILVMAVFWIIGYTTRPHVISALFIALELYALESYRISRSRAIWIIPLLSVLFINFHNSLWPFLYIIALPYFAQYMLESADKQQVRSIKTAFLAYSLSIPAALINPYRIDAILYIFRSMPAIKPIEPFIIELQPTTPASISGALLALPVVLLYVAYKRPIKRRIPVSHALLAAGTYLMALMHMRSWAQCLLCGSLLLCDVMSSVLVKKRTVLVEGKSSSRVLRFMERMTVPVLCFAVICTMLMTSRYVSASLNSDGYIEYLEENCSKDTCIFNSINVGPKLAYYGYRPYIDTRLEVYGEELNHKHDYMQEYVDAVYHGIGVEELMNAYPFEVAILLENDCKPVKEYLSKSPDWKEVYHEEDIVTIFECIEQQDTIPES